jgi:exodeoxyribonuclease V alpha subunit
VVVFPDNESEARYRTISPGRLPPHETVFAMTVHKSQGSEFERVVVVLPPKRSPILTRELLYTGVTRARSHVAIVGTSEVITQGITQSVRRASGLQDLLW